MKVGLDHDVLTMPKKSNEILICNSFLDPQEVGLPSITKKERRSSDIRRSSNDDVRQSSDDVRRAVSSRLEEEQSVSAKFCNN